jgi:hypothetical protein
MMRGTHILIFLIFFSGFSFYSQSSFISADSRTKNDGILHARITELKVGIESYNSFFYEASIEIYNPNSFSINVNHSYWCGFEISLDPRINVTYNFYNGYSDCYLPKYDEFGLTPGSLYPKTYDQGFFHEKFNSTVTFDFKEYNSTDLPIGKYYFDIPNAPNLVSVEKLSALMIYHGNNNKEYQYNISSSWIGRSTDSTETKTIQTSILGTFPTVTLDEDSGFPLGNKSPNPFTIFVVVVVMGILVVSYLYRRNSKQRMNQESENSSISRNLDNSKYRLRFSTFCSNCGIKSELGDQYCENCGEKLV